MNLQMQSCRGGQVSRSSSDPRSRKSELEFDRQIGAEDRTRQKAIDNISQIEFRRKIISNRFAVILCGLKRLVTPLFVSADRDYRL